MNEKSGPPAADSNAAAFGEKIVTDDQHTPTDPDDPADRFVDHFEPILCETDEDRELVERLAERVREYDVTDWIIRAPDGEEVILDEEDDGDVLYVELENPRDEVDTVVCEPPYEGDVDASVPASSAELAAHHDGVFWNVPGRGGLGANSLTADGLIAPIGDYPLHLDEGDPAYVDALREAGLTPHDLGWPFAAGQNFVLFDPLRERANGEPGLAFVDHAVSKMAPLHEADPFDAGQVLLRLMADYFLDTDEHLGVWP